MLIVVCTVFLFVDLKENEELLEAGATVLDGVGDADEGNANRELCTSNGIHTSFVQKGKRAKGEREKSFARENLARVRATTMEESFGIYTANAIALSGRIAKLQPAAG